MRVALFEDFTEEKKLNILVLIPISDSFVAEKPLSAFPEQLRIRIVAALELCGDRGVRSISYISHKHVVVHTETGNFLIERYLPEHEKVRSSLDLTYWYVRPKFERRLPMVPAGPPEFCIHCHVQRRPNSAHCFNCACVSHELWSKVDASYVPHKRNTGGWVLSQIPQRQLATSSAPLKSTISESSPEIFAGLSLDLWISR